MHGLIPHRRLLQQSRFIITWGGCFEVQYGAFGIRATNLLDHDEPGKQRSSRDRGCTRRYLRLAGTPADSS
jgi:hypothetical protein